MNVCICSSFRFYDDVLAICGQLEATGIKCLRPIPSAYREKTKPTEFKKQFIQMADNDKQTLGGTMSRMHFERIDAADVVYVYNPQGYVGNSVLTEIGYSFGRGKPIYSSEPIQDPLIAGLIDKIIPKAKLVDELKKIV